MVASAEKELAHLMGSTLGDLNTPPRGATTAPFPLAAGTERSYMMTFDRCSRHQRSILRIRQITTDLYEVLAHHTVPRMRHSGSQIAVIGEQKEAL